MRTIFISFLSLILISSCKKELDSFLPKYAAIKGTWKTQSISYDSSGVFVTKTLRFDRLVINDDLTYKIFHDSVNNLENGFVRIVTQSDSDLELFFEAHYPTWSSFAGSHIFAHSTVSLIKLSEYELILRDLDEGYFSPIQYHFTRF
jgi:hypothetical protein